MGVATFNLQFPDMSGMNSTDIKRELQKIKDYVYMLNEQLRYHFSNIDETNIVDGSIGESALSIPVKTQIQDTAGNVSKLQQTAKSISADIESIEGDLAQIVLEADSLLTMVENNEGDISSIQQAATALTSRVSNAEGDISTLQQTTSNISASVQTIQGGITNKSMVEIADDRASIATSSGVQTSHISVLGNQIDIATGGKLNATGAEVNIKAGSSMNISSGGDFNLSAGTGDIGVGISTTDQQKFLWGGAGTGMGYPKFYVARDGSYMVFAGLAINELSNAQGIPYSVYISPLSYSSLINLHSYQFVNINKQSYDSSTGTWGAVTSVVVGFTDGLVNISQNLYVDNNVSALTFTDRTPFYRGNALRDIKMITSDSDGNIIHSSLPKCARVNIRSLKEEAKKRLQQNKTTRTKGTGKIDGVQVVQETFIEDDYEITEGRDLSVMVSMLTVAVKQLTEIVEKQQTQIDSLLEQQTSRQSIARK
jgi:hypothetical protein